MPPFRTMPFPPNPDYGMGEARRIVRLDKPAPDIVDAHLIDTYHEMRLRLRHDGMVVTGIDGQMIRFPTTACPGAPSMIQELVSMRLDIDPRALNDRLRVRRNCTHLFDIAALSLRHALRPAASRTYEAVVPDAIDTATRIEVRCDAVTVHSWLVRDGHILAPEALVGLPILKGFARWSSAMFAGDRLEAAAFLSKTCFIATIRPFATQVSAGTPIASNRDMAGACYAYAPGRIAQAHYTDQTDSPGRQP